MFSSVCNIWLDLTYLNDLSFNCTQKTKTELLIKLPSDSFFISYLSDLSKQTKTRKPHRILSVQCWHYSLHENLLGVIVFPLKIRIFKLLIFWQSILSSDCSSIGNHTKINLEFKKFISKAWYFWHCWNLDEA